jgi:hypothetical protein
MALIFLTDEELNKVIEERKAKGWLVFSMLASEETADFSEYLEQHYFQPGTPKNKNFEISFNPQAITFFLYPDDKKTRGAVAYSALMVDLRFETPLSRMESYMKRFERSKSLEEGEVCLSDLLTEFAAYLKEKEGTALNEVKVYLVNDEKWNDKRTLVLEKDVTIENNELVEKKGSAVVVVNVRLFEEIFNLIFALVATFASFLLREKYEKKVLVDKVYEYVEDFLEITLPDEKRESSKANTLERLGGDKQ